MHALVEQDVTKKNQEQKNEYFQLEMILDNGILKSNNRNYFTF
jgi:hypothetical protein